MVSRSNHERQPLVLRRAQDEREGALLARLTRLESHAVRRLHLIAAIPVVIRTGPAGAGPFRGVVRAEQPPPLFRWAGDPEGGAPFVEADPAHPETVTGFDVEVAALMARGLGRAPQFLNIQF